MLSRSFSGGDACDHSKLGTRYTNSATSSRRRSPGRRSSIVLACAFIAPHFRPQRPSRRRPVAGMSVGIDPVGVGLRRVSTPPWGFKKSTRRRAAGSGVAKIDLDTARVSKNSVRGRLDAPDTLDRVQAAAGSVSGTLATRTRRGQHGPPGRLKARGGSSPVSHFVRADTGFQSS
jgi:hypothetical protein